MSIADVSDIRRNLPPCFWQFDLVGKRLMARSRSSRKQRARARRRTRQAGSPEARWLVPAALVWLGVAGLGWLIGDWHPYAAWLAGGGVATAMLFGVDKLLAKMGGQRIPERTLLGAVAVGGVVGGWVGMLGFHHKTRHGVFWLVLLVATAAHGGLAFALGIIER
jgi:uncharacterized membrane protein YsdA (DUF1294 family)